MISFKLPPNLDALLPEELEYYNELTSDIRGSLDSDCEADFAITSLCLITRIFDLGRYSFIYPIALSERADEAEALLDVNEDAMREEIERIFTDVPKNSLSLFFDRFRHIDIDREDLDGESFRVKIKTECELLEEIPSLDFEEISLTPLKDDDSESYARLLRDEETNKYWGYDFREDFSENAPDEIFLENARMEFARGSAITLAIRRENAFSGELALYAFDGEGGAELAIRLLPEKRRNGLGTLSFSALIEYAKMIGLTRLFAFVDKRNEASLKYLGKLMDLCAESDTRVKFSYDLY